MRAPVVFSDNSCKMQTVTEQRDGTFTVIRFGQTIQVAPTGLGFNQVGRVDFSHPASSVPERIRRQLDKPVSTIAAQLGMRA